MLRSRCVNGGGVEIKFLGDLEVMDPAGGILDRFHLHKKSPRIIMGF